MAVREITAPEKAAPAAGAKGRRGNLYRSPGFWGMIFISPWLLGFLLFTAGPMLMSLYLSLCKYDLHTLQFVGAKNYEVLLTRDPLFWKSLRNTALYVLFSVPIGLTGSLFIALLLNHKVKGIALFRTLFYLPSLVPAVASALVWQWVFHPDSGILNYGLSKVGIQGPAWLVDPDTALPSLIIMSLWGVGGGRMIIFLAGLQGISDELYEAAALDGAKGWTIFRNVTLPMLSPTIFFNLVLGIIGSFQVFTSAYIMTAGGPDNATLMFVLYLYNNAFRYFKLGKASAMAWILFAILLVFTVVQFKQASKWVYYEGGEKE
jgi:ABC-type sugar transport systems, permease components